MEGVGSISHLSVPTLSAQQIFLKLQSLGRGGLRGATSREWSLLHHHKCPHHTKPDPGPLCGELPGQGGQLQCHQQRVCEGEVPEEGTRHHDRLEALSVPQFTLNINPDYS